MNKSKTKTEETYLHFDMSELHLNFRKEGLDSRYNQFHIPPYTSHVLITRTGIGTCVGMLVFVPWSLVV